MLTGKQRAYLRSLANGIQAKYQVGKAGIDDEAFLTQLDLALEKNELIKITVLETAPESPRATSDALCEKLGADGVQAIGKKIVLYRKSKEEPVIELPR
ncbi:MAG: YhbY family RNA-binding protein [Clostridia bacterium]|nr:YhbY family RNA-binding protein [Clostridia bacterium]